MKSLLFAILLLCSSHLLAQGDTIKVHFLYGSKPAKEHKNSESKHFGGLKGGHVNIESAGRILDFMPGNCPLFPSRKNPTGGFRINHSVYWDTATNKWATILVPITKSQMKSLDSLYDLYSAKTPYDYAVFGMRCAAASYDVLSKIGLFEELSNGKNVVKHFYPKLLRKRMFKWAKANNYTITTNIGRVSRKWESDKGWF